MHQLRKKVMRQRFNLKLNEPKVREQYQIEITNRFAGMENFNGDKDVNGFGKTLKRIYIRQ